MARSTRCIGLRRIMHKFPSVLLLCVLIAAQKTELDSPENLYILRNFRKWIFNNFGGEQLHRPTPKYLQGLQIQLPPDVPFPCNVTGGRSPQVPDSVHRLRPGDIDVIAAIGDSITAGSGIFAFNMMQLLIESRGVVATIGGQANWRTFLTLPNILKEFNPNLIGYSTGDSFTFQTDSQFNVAEFGALGRDMPFMAKYLVDRMKQDSRVNIREHWKLITILIGHNDFCSEICHTPSPSSILKTYRSNLIDTLRILRDNLPRTFVITSNMLDLDTYADVMKSYPVLRCYTMTRFFCPCLFGLQYQDRAQEYYDIMKRWTEMEDEVVNYPEFNTEDFTVVSSPALQKLTPPLRKNGELDNTYASIDCFHPAQKLNAEHANALWNNLLEPVGNKTYALHPLFKIFLCPTPDKPFLMTRENSRAEWEK